MQKIPSKFMMLKGLDEPLAYYPLKYGFLKRTGSLLLGFASVIAGILMIGMAGLQAFDRYYHHGPAVVWRGLFAPGLVGLFLIAAGVYAGVYALRRWKKAVVLFEHGIAVEDMGGIHTSTWKDLASLRMAVSQRTFSGISIGIKRKYTIIRTDGEQFIFDGEISNAEAVADKIRAQVLPILYERYEHEFESGQEFVFGAVEIHKDNGIRIKQKNLPWDVVEKAAVQDGELSFSLNEPKGRQNLLRIPVAEIPNLDLLMIFIRQVKPA